MYEIEHTQERERKAFELKSRHANSLVDVELFTILMREMEIPEELLVGLKSGDRFPVWYERSMWLRQIWRF